MKYIFFIIAFMVAGITTPVNAQTAADSQASILVSKTYRLQGRINELEGKKNELAGELESLKKELKVLKTGQKLQIIKNVRKRKELGDNLRKELDELREANSKLKDASEGGYATGILIVLLFVALSGLAYFCYTLQKQLNKLSVEPQKEE